MAITNCSVRSLAASALLMLPLAGCSDPLGKAEQRYETVLKSGASAAEVCAEGHALTSTYLASADAARYRETQTRASVECMTREMEEQKGIYRDNEGNKVTISADFSAMPNAQ